MKDVVVYVKKWYWLDIYESWWRRWWWNICYKWICRVRRRKKEKENLDCDVISKKYSNIIGFILKSHRTR